MNAKEAKFLSEKANSSISEVLFEKIKNCAESGDLDMNWYDSLNSKQIKELKQLGYKVKKSPPVMDGFPCYYIHWG